MLKTIIHDYPQIHLGLGLVGNLLFFVGSILFFPRFEAWQTAGVWMFVIGSAGMLIGSIGKAFTDIETARQRRDAR